jgi:spore coat polysaccharide biosynthesis protein SpsF
MEIVGVIQARMGSTRLPGKMMYPLDGETVLSHIIRRTRCSETLSKIVVATSTKERDTVIANETVRQNAQVFRGSESDVLGRVHNAAAEADADIVVRICADNPFLPPDYIDAIVNQVEQGEIDYASNNLNRTIPVGLDVEVFTMGSFSLVETGAESDEEREHVTVYYKNHPELFSIENIPASDVFSNSRLLNREDLRLTLDTLPDYELIKRVYREVDKDSRGIVPLKKAICCIDEKGLSDINAGVAQKEVDESE